MADQPVEVEVQQVLKGPTEWNDKDIYEVLFADRDGKHSFFCFHDEPAPTDSGTEKGWFGTKGNGDPKFTRASDNASGNGGQSRSKGSSGRFDRSPDHPRQEARAIHTSALSATPNYIEQMLTIGAVPQPKDKDEYVKMAEGVMVWLKSTYQLPDRD